MNKNTWDKLAEEDKQAICSAAEKAYQTLGSVMDSSFDAVVEELRNNSAHIRKLNASEVAQWETSVNYQQVQEKRVKEQEGKDVKDAGQTMKKVTALLKETMK